MLRKAAYGLATALLAGCGASQSVSTREAPAPQATEIAGSVGSSIFAGCRGSVDGPRSTLECDDFVLLAIGVSRDVAPDFALDQAISTAGIETGRSEIEVNGVVHPLRTYELRNPGAEVASVTALVTAIPKFGELIVMHCGSTGVTPKVEQCQEAYSAYLLHGVPAEAVATSKHTDTSEVDFAGRQIRFGAGCRAPKEDLVQCDNGELTWQIRSQRSDLLGLFDTHKELTAKKIEARGGAITSEKKMDCLLDLNHAECTETIVDLGMDQLGKLTVYTAMATVRGNAVFAVCSFFPGDGSEDAPTPCSEVFEF